MAAEETEISEETLADAIRKVSAAAQALAGSGLNRKAVIALLHDKTKLSKKNIQLVLDNLEELAAYYTTSEED